MNTKNNQLSRSTDEKIMRTVYRKIIEDHKSVSRITVREVCEEAKINRSTFYAHYQDIYDVVEKAESGMSRMLTTSLLETLEKTGSIHKLFEQVFEFVKTHQDFYTLYFQDSRHAGVIGLAWDMINERVDDQTYRQLGFQSMTDMEYTGAFFVSGLTTMVRIWLEKGCKESPEHLVSLLIRE